MTVVREVVDALELVARTVSNVREIVDAVNDGKAFLTKNYPDARQDLVELLEEISKTMRGTALASRVVTHFRFTIAGPGRAMEPRIFNDYVIASKTELQDLRDNIGKLRSSCHKIEVQERALTKRSGGPWWFGIVGKKWDQRSQELANTFHDVFAADAQIVYYTESMLQAVEITLHAVSDALGPTGVADPANVPKAARVLGEHADRFLPIEQGCMELVGELQSLAVQLR